MPFPTTRSASSNPFTGSEKVTAIENAPVTGSLAELVMVTVGAAVFAVMENWSAAALGFPELSCAAPAAMSTVTVPETSGVIVAVCRSRGSPPAAASPDTAPPESSGSYRAFGGRLQGCPRRVWHFIAGSPSGAGDAELAGADGAACPDRCTSSFDCRWRGCLRRAGLVHLAVTQS